jgi:hypothetical protein
VCHGSDADTGENVGEEGRGGECLCARPEPRSFCTRGGAQKGGKGKGNVRSQQNKKRTRAINNLSLALPPQRGGRGSERFSARRSSHRASASASQLLDHPFVHFIFHSTLINPCSSLQPLLSYISSSVSDYDDHSNDKGPRRLPANLFTILFSQDRQLLSFILILVNPFSCYL